MSEILKGSFLTDKKGRKMEIVDAEARAKAEENAAAIGELSEGKTHYSDSINFEWDGDMSNPNYFNGAMLISSSITRVEQLDGLSVVLSKWMEYVSTYDLDPTPTPDEGGTDNYRKFDSEPVVIDTSDAGDSGDGSWSIRVEASIPELQIRVYTVLIILSKEYTLPNGSTMKPGLYCEGEIEEGETFVSKLYGEYVVKTLDPKYLPKPIPAKYLPKPIPAEYLPEGVGGVTYYLGENNHLYHDDDCSLEVTYDEGVAAMFGGVIRVISGTRTAIWLPTAIRNTGTGIRLSYEGRDWFIGSEDTGPA